MAFELQDVANDGDLAESFTVSRSFGGNFGPGGWADNKITIPAWGIVSLASLKQIAALPEADRVHEARSFISEQVMFTTSTKRGAVSDILIWNNVFYRVASVAPYQNRGGYYEAIALRMMGS